MDSLTVASGVEALKERALLVRDEGLIAVSDLHLGYEGVLHREGVAIPRKQKTLMLNTLGHIIDRYSPEILLLNGDIKHNFSRNLDEEWLEVKEVLRFMDERARLIVVRGNHDNYLADILHDMGIELRRSYRIGSYAFAHGHWDIRTKLPVIIGHEHPSLKLRDRIGAVISLPAFVVASDLIIMPAFSPLALGVDVSSHPYLSPLLRSRDMRNARIYGADENEGVLDFGPVSRLRAIGASLTLM